MRSILIILVFGVFILACGRIDRNMSNIKSEWQYVRITSKEKKVWLLPFNCLYSITPYSPFDENLGKYDRIKILIGKDLLSNSTIENLSCSPLFELPNSLDSYKNFIDSTKNNDTININSLSYPLDGIYINELITRGYIVTFGDYEGEFRVRK